LGTVTTITFVLSSVSTKCCLYLFQRFEFAEEFTHDLPQPVRFWPPPIALEFAGKRKNGDWNGAMVMT
jgi:hypothetical protein